MSQTTRPPVLGIDLGDSKCRACFVHQDKPVLVIPDLAYRQPEPGRAVFPDRLMPSAFAYHEGQALVGHRAMQLWTDPEHRDDVVLSIKRHIANDRSYRVNSGGRTFSPSEIVGHFVRVLVRAAEVQAGLQQGQITEAVIAIPADYGSAAREAMNRAGTDFGGLSKVWFVDAPVAAAYSLGLHRSDATSRVLVVDIGDSAFGVTLLEVGREVRPGAFKELGRDGDSSLGGQDWDHEIADWIVREAEPKLSREAAQALMDNAESYGHATLFHACERAKIYHSHQLQDLGLDDPSHPVDTRNLKPLYVNFQILPNGRPYTGKMPAEAFIQATERLLRQAARVCERLFEDMNYIRNLSSFGWSEIDSIYMTGGGSQLPTVRRRFAELSGRRPILAPDPPNAVVIGAARLGGDLVAERGIPLYLGKTHYPHAIGVLRRSSLDPGRRSEFVPLVERNSPTPFVRIGRFQVDRVRGQSPMRILIAEEEARLSRVIHRPIREIHLDDLPEDFRSAGEILELTAVCDKNGELSFAAEFRGKRIGTIRDPELASGHVAEIHGPSWTSPAIGAGREDVVTRPAKPDMPPERPEGPDRPAGAPLEENRPTGIDEVQFTVYRPKVVSPGVWHPLLAFMHLADRRPDAPADEPDPIEQVRAQAARILNVQAKAYRDTSVDAHQAVPRESEITLIPVIAGVEFNPDRRVFRWIKDVHREEFDFRASPSLDGSAARGRLSAYLGVILIAEVDLAIRVDSAARAATPDLKPEAARPYRKIFASYSHADDEIVRQYEWFGETMGDRYFRDVRDLRSGEKWDDALLRLIEQADVFQLFWSSNSMHSPFVRREWEYALALGRDHFIRPTHWEDPLPEAPDLDLPPEALRRLQFHRIVSVALASHAGAGAGTAQAVELDRAARRTEQDRSVGPARADGPPTPVGRPTRQGETTWFLRDRGRVRGPYTEQQLATLWKRGQLARFHDISTDRKTWVKASSVLDSFSARDTSPAPAAPPAQAIDSTPLPGGRASWFFSQSGQAKGPVDDEGLRQLISRGMVSSTTLVWREGWSSWIPVGDVDELLSRQGMAEASLLPGPAEIRDGSEFADQRTEARRLSKLATASFVLGILALGGLAAAAIAAVLYRLLVLAR